MKTSEEILALVDVAFAVPVTLILNFSLFQYLVSTFWPRRRERRVRLLLFVAFLSFSSMIPFAFPDRRLSVDLTGISEVCTMLTFLMQITILTRDVSKRIKIRSVWALMWCGECLVTTSLCLLIVNVIQLVSPVIDEDTVHLIDNILEHIALVFIVCFRFYFLSMAKGYRKVLATQKNEIIYYALFLTHEVPFHLLEQYTHLDWHHIQGLWMRTTIVMCLSSTIRARISSMRSKGMTTTKHGPIFTNASSHANNKSVDSAREAGTPVLPWRKTSIVRSAAGVVPEPNRLKSPVGNSNVSNGRARNNKESTS